jgi:uncharacterized membrane protein
MEKRNKTIYWVSTILLVSGMLSGGLAQLFRAKQTADGIIHLGYPVYFLSIMGTWKILGVIAILIPKFKLLKEWAYAGFFFAMTGAVISHIASGDRFAEFIAPLIFALLSITSWYFRPADRRIALINNK